MRIVDKMPKCVKLKWWRGDIWVKNRKLFFGIFRRFLAFFGIFLYFQVRVFANLFNVFKGLRDSVGEFLVFLAGNMFCSLHVHD